MSSKNPFDFSEMFKQMDPAKMAEQFQEMLSQTPFAGFDPAALADSQRKNLEAQMEAGKAAVSGAQALFDKQSEMMQQALSEAAEVLKSVTDKEPEEVAKKNADMVESAIKKSMDNFTEIAGMMQNIYGEVSEKVEQRMKENIEELRESLTKNQ